MIKLSDSSLMLSRPDGSLIDFDVEALQTEIIKSFLAAGVRDAWIAEDIVLAVEYALLQNSRPGNQFSVSEVNSTIIKILEETGYPEVADVYRKNNARLEVEFSPDPEYLSQLISRHLGLTGKTLDTVAAKVSKAVAVLGIDSATPALFAELAKFYKARLPQDQEIKISGFSAHNAQTNTESISEKEIQQRLKPETRELIKRGILRIQGISPLFPAVRLTLKFTMLTAGSELEPPVTEMMLIPKFPAPAAAVNDCVRTAQELFSEYSEESHRLPVYLQVPDMSTFAAGYLNTPWPEGKGCCIEMFNYFERLLDVPLFKLQMN